MFLMVIAVCGVFLDKNHLHTDGETGHPLSFLKINPSHLQQKRTNKHTHSHTHTQTHFSHARTHASISICIYTNTLYSTIHSNCWFAAYQYQKHSFIFTWKSFLAFLRQKLNVRALNRYHRHGSRNHRSYNSFQ